MIRPSFVAALVLLTGCQVSDPPAPARLAPSVQIVRPAADVAPALARFSGLWSGAWGGVLDSKLAVQTIDPDGTAQVAYAWGDHPGGRFPAGSLTAIGTIAGDTLTLPPLANGAQLQFRLRADGALDASYVLDGATSRGVFQKS